VADLVIPIPERIVYSAPGEFLIVQNRADYAKASASELYINGQPFAFVTTNGFTIRPTSAINGFATVSCELVAASLQIIERPRGAR